MNKLDLVIGMKVKVVPIHSNKALPAPKETQMYVRELHNPLVAGLSRKKTGKRHIYGILYELIQPVA